MAEFEPFLGQFNPTNQQFNEYIRKLKVALVDPATSGTEASTYSGDGNASQVITLATAGLTPQIVIIGNSTGTKRLGFTHTTLAAASNSAFIIENSTGAAVYTGRIGTLTKGAFTVLSNSTTTGMNESQTYYYFVMGTLTPS